MLKTTGSYLHSSGQNNTGTWRTDRRTESPWLLARSALWAMRTRCKNGAFCGYCRTHAMLEVERTGQRWPMTMGRYWNSSFDPENLFTSSISRKRRHG